MLDHRLYRNDFMMQEFLRFTPRFYYNLLIYLPAAAGVPLPWVFAGWQFIAVGTFVTGLRALARALGVGPVAAAVFVVWVMQVDAGELGVTTLYLPSPAPGLWAAAIAVWGAALAVQQRWRAAYFCFGAAVLLQFLVGFYAGLLLLPALWQARGLRSMPRDIAGWVLGMAAVYVPMKLGGHHRQRRADPMRRSSRFMPNSGTRTTSFPRPGAGWRGWRLWFFMRAPQPAAAGSAGPQPRAGAGFSAESCS